jgi:hypothetical protein
LRVSAPCAYALALVSCLGALRLRTRLRLLYTCVLCLRPVRVMSALGACFLGTLCLRTRLRLLSRRFAPAHSSATLVHLRVMLAWRACVECALSAMSVLTVCVACLRPVRVMLAARLRRACFGCSLTVQRLCCVFVLCTRNAIA